MADFDVCLDRETNRADANSPGLTAATSVAEACFPIVQRLVRGIAMWVGLAGPAMAALTIYRAEDLLLATADEQRGRFGAPFMTFGPIRVDRLANPKAAQMRPLLDDLWQAASWEDGTPSVTDAGWTGSLSELP